MSERLSSLPLRLRRTSCRACMALHVVRPLPQGEPGAGLLQESTHVSADREEVPGWRPGRCGDSRLTGSLRPAGDMRFPITICSPRLLDAFCTVAALCVPVLVDISHCSLRVCLPPDGAESVVYLAGGARTGPGNGPCKPPAPVPLAEGAPHQRDKAAELTVPAAAGGWAAGTEGPGPKPAAGRPSSGRVVAGGRVGTASGAGPESAQGARLSLVVRKLSL